MLILKAIYIGLFTGIVIALPTGPAGIESVRWTVSKGLKYGILVVAGAMIADVIDVVLINFGVLEFMETNKFFEILFWELSGIIIFYVGFKAIKNKDAHILDKDNSKLEQSSSALFTGFIISISNPMTHFVWLTLSGTALRLWRGYGCVVYFIFLFCLILGMFITLVVLNLLAWHSKKIIAPKNSGKLDRIIAFIMIAVGIVFSVRGLYKLYFLIRYL
jgi:threonine/homoserine/homoserine lactone efflux protein